MIVTWWLLIKSRVVIISERLSQVLQVIYVKLLCQREYKTVQTNTTDWFWRMSLFHIMKFSSYYFPMPQYRVLISGEGAWEGGTQLFFGRDVWHGVLQWGFKELICFQKKIKIFQLYSLNLIQMSVHKPPKWLKLSVLWILQFATNFSSRCQRL